MAEEFKLGLSFDDVLLVPKKSSILPSEADIGSLLAAEINLNIPVLSSAMDTVTEAELAIALAREGGMGVIHRNCPIKEQASYVKKVKRSENTIIKNPISVKGDTTLGELHAIMNENGVSGFPVVDDEKNLVGMVTNRDTWCVEDESIKVSQMMTPKDEVISSSENVSHEEARETLYKHRLEKLPLVNDEGKLSGMITTKDIEIRQRFTSAAKDQNGQLRVGAAIGVGGDSLERAEAMINSGADALFIDAATGHTSRVLNVVKELSANGNNVPVVAGNVVTSEGAKDLIEAGVSAVKVGVGPGSICTTTVSYTHLTLPTS
mgnify:FL=1